jgi:hypothetical protein
MGGVVERSGGGGHDGSWIGTCTYLAEDVKTRQTKVLIVRFPVELYKQSYCGYRTMHNCADAIIDLHNNLCMTRPRQMTTALFEFGYV